MSPRGTILVVDTEPDVVQFMVEVLNDEGYTAIGVRRAVEAMVTMKALPPDLVLAELLLQEEISGLDILRAGQQHDPPIPVVIMTVSVHRANALEREGSAMCLRKPFGIDDLLACVARHIRITGEALPQPLTPDT